ncbi:hypothetical protein [Peptostreptococcus canis]|uniref:ABC transporter permease n=1 Tax=Peptostreptococcus canis TaxID=1159213 RepID=A0ABR6TLA2_9FIRM|nr:hypothetical protein [Peptostreptococcus canis]MBC2576187.1 hypothetical protein [Peptostreptococcus canis]MBP1998278.1 hypothetical protein [Peptostreptococcus canis]
MLGKLIKYELKSSIRYFIPIYIALLVIFSINAISLSFSFKSEEISSSFGIFSGIMVFATMAVIITLTIMLLYITVKRFATGFYGDEGYLTNTLPVSTHKIIFSKAITMLILNIISFIVLILAIALITIPLFNIVDAESSGQAFLQIKQFWREFSNELTIVIMLFILLEIISSFANTFIIYLCVAVAHLKSFVNKKILVGVILYILISVLQGFLFSPSDKSIKTLDALNNPEVANNFSSSMSIILKHFQSLLTTQTLIILVMGIIAYSITYYLLKGKLNIE